MTLRHATLRRYATTALGVLENMAKPDFGTISLDSHRLPGSSADELGTKRFQQN
jgi:hypothetical protein